MTRQAIATQPKVTPMISPLLECGGEPGEDSLDGELGMGLLASFWNISWTAVDDQYAGYRVPLPERLLSVFYT